MKTIVRARRAGRGPRSICLRLELAYSAKGGAWGVEGICCTWIGVSEPPIACTLSRRSGLVWAGRFLDRASGGGRYFLSRGAKRLRLHPGRSTLAFAVRHAGMMTYRLAMSREALTFRSLMPPCFRITRTPVRSDNPDEQRIPSPSRRPPR